MKTLDLSKMKEYDQKVLKISFAAAFLLEFLLLTVFGNWEHWLAHPQKTTGLDDSKFIEAQVYEIPKEAHLVEEKKIAAPQVKEAAISKTVGSGKKTPEAKSAVEETNQTDSGPKMVADHGPIAISAPPPVIPQYLRDKELSSSVVIEFLVNNQGMATPRLIGSSGNEELDAVALAQVRKWQFKPAEQNHQPIDAKIRLRINFQVD